MKDEENKTGISMDMGGAIEPVVLPVEEEEVKVEVPEVRSTEIPQLMQIGNDNTEVPPIMEGLVETETPKEEVKVEEKPKPVPVPTIGPIPTPAPAAPNLEQIKNEAKAEALAAAKPVPVPTIGPLPTQPATPPEVKVETPVVTEAPTVEVPVATVPEVPVAPAQPVQPAPAPTPTVPVAPAAPAVTVAPAPTSQEVPVAQVVAPAVPTVAVPETSVTTTPEVQTVTIPVAQEPIAEQVVVPTEPTDDLDKTMVIPAPVEGTTEEGPAVIKGPNVIEAPIATENKEKEKKKNPYFLECPPNCIPIKPMGYIGYELLYAIPIIGLIFMLAHSASIKNYNRRNFARSHLIIILLIILAIVALVYLFDFDIIGFIENLTGYKIDIQHFKFTKFK